MKFRKKPVEIEARQWLGTNWQEMQDWGWSHGKCFGYDVSEGALYVVTLEGNMRADKGDWIIRGVKGEFYPCKQDIFAQTYEPA